MDVSILVKGLESQLGGVLASHVIEVRPEQLLKAYIAILVIPYGILIELRAEHP